MANGNESTTPLTSPNIGDDPLKRRNYSNDEVIKFADRFEDKEEAFIHLKRALDVESLKDVSSPQELKERILKSGFFSDRKNEDAQAAVEKINQKLQEALDSRLTELYYHVKSNTFRESDVGEIIEVSGSIEDAEVSQNLNKGATADPIILFNGNFVYSSTDLTLQGGGIDFAFTRNYSQLSVFNSILGYKWDHSYNLWLRLSSDTNLLFRSNGALRETTYRRQNIHNYWFADFGEEGVIFERDNRFIWRTSDGVEFRYADNLSDRADILLIDRIEDRFGNYLQFSYQDALLQTVEVNNPLRKVFFAYDSENRIVKITDFTNRSWKYTYDDMGDLVAVTTPTTQEYPKGLTTCYEYSSYQFSSIVQQHNLLSIIDASGQIYLENEYGTEPNLLSFNRVIRQRQGSGETYLEYADVIEDFDFPYTAHQRPAYQTIETDRNGQQIRYLFNRYGNMVFREEYARINGIPKLVGTHYRYNQDGNLVGTINPSGIITQFLYGRDFYERKEQVEDDYLATEDANLTLTIRQGFNRMLASVKRGKYYNVTTLNLNQGLWSPDIFPDIFAVANDDIIQKFQYEPEFGQPLSISDPRHTQSPNPDFVEGIAFTNQLTKYQYKTQNGSPFYLLDRITSPSATAPDGSIIGNSVSKFLTYDNRGRLLKSENAIGLETQLEYFTIGVIEGLLKKSTLDPTGFNIQSGVERDNLGRVIKTFEPRYFEFQDGRFISEAKINELGQITETISTSPFNISTKRKYNKTGNLKEEIQEVKNGDGILQKDLFLKTNYIYDQEFRLIKTQQGNFDDTFYRFNKTVFDGANRPAISLSPMGKKTKTIYNERSLPFKEIVDYGGIGINTKKYYDAEGRVVRIIDSRGGTSRITYDALNRPIQMTNSEGNVIYISYDKLGNKLTERFFERVSNDEFILQSRMEYHYDELGRLIKQGVNLFENNIDKILKKDLQNTYLNVGIGKLLVSTFFYDIGGRLVKMIDQSNRISLQEYDVLGRKTKQIDFYGNEVSFKYDSVGNLIRVDKKEVIKNINDQIIGSRHFATQSVFDELNRVVETIDTLGNKTALKYDTRGLLEKSINALGEETDITFDVFGRQLKTTQYLNADNPVLKTPVTTAYQYDLDNFITKQMDALGRETTFLYNSLGKNIATVLPDLSTDQKEYDFSGMLKSYKDRNGLMALYNRDIVGRIIGSQIDRAQLDNSITIEGADFSISRFDSLGRLIQSENDFSICQYLYNSLGWLQKETSTTKPFMAGLVTQPLVTERAYNDNGALTNITYPSGRQLQYGLDILDRMTQIEQITKGNNFTGNNITPNNYTIAQIEYEGLQRKSIKRANNIHTEYNYDFGGRMVGINHLLEGNNLLTMQFLYDAVGNMRQKAELGNGLQLAKGFDYDELHRLKNVRKDNIALIQDLTNVQPSAIKLPNPIPNAQSIIDGLVRPIVSLEKEYALDLVGNRTIVSQDNAADVNYNVNALDQYAQIEGELFTYDKNGNLLKEGQFEYRYDANNRLTSVWNKGTGLNILSYHYDTFGKKVVESSSGTTKQYIYSAINPIEEYENTVLKSTNVLDMGMDNFLQINTNSKDLYLLSDLVKSTRLVLNDNQISDFYNYDEFGAVIGQNPSSGQYLFQGKKWIEEIGKYDYFTRFYDPSVGRFQQRDSKGYVAGTNLYAFVRNSPLSRTDPFGTKEREEREKTKRDANLSLGDSADVNGAGLELLKNIINGKIDLEMAKVTWLTYMAAGLKNKASLVSEAEDIIKGVRILEKAKPFIEFLGNTLDIIGGGFAAYEKVWGNKKVATTSVGLGIDGLLSFGTDFSLGALRTRGGSPIGIAITALDALAGFGQEKIWGKKYISVGDSLQQGNSNLVAIGEAFTGRTEALEAIDDKSEKGGYNKIVQGYFEIGKLNRDFLYGAEIAEYAGNTFKGTWFEYPSAFIGSTPVVGHVYGGVLYTDDKIDDANNYISDKMQGAGSAAVDWAGSRDWGKTIRPWRWFD